MNFIELLRNAKNNDVIALTTLMERYQPLLIRESIVDGVFDEDLYQELRITMLRCIRTFQE